MSERELLPKHPSLSLLIVFLREKMQLLHLLFGHFDPLVMELDASLFETASTCVQRDVMGLVSCLWQLDILSELDISFLVQ